MFRSACFFLFCASSRAAHGTHTRASSCRVHRWPTHQPPAAALERVDGVCVVSGVSSCWLLLRLVAGVCWFAAGTLPSCAWLSWFLDFSSQLPVKGMAAYTHRWARSLPLALTPVVEAHTHTALTHEQPHTQALWWCADPFLLQSPGFGEGSPIHHCPPHHGSGLSSPPPVYCMRARCHLQPAPVHLSGQREGISVTPNAVLGAPAHATLYAAVRLAAGHTLLQGTGRCRVPGVGGVTGGGTLL
jgi:hypothetical protein